MSNYLNVLTVRNALTTGAPAPLSVIADGDFIANLGGVGGKMYEGHRGHFVDATTPNGLSLIVLAVIAEKGFGKDFPAVGPLQLNAGKACLAGEVGCEVDVVHGN